MIEQIIWTRIDTMVGVAGMMRRLLNEAVWHTRRRSAFGAPLASQPAMVNVLADLALESEAAAARLVPRSCAPSTRATAPSGAWRWR